MIDTFKDFLSGSIYYDLPSFEVALFSLLLGFVLSSAVAFTYKLTFRGQLFPNHFFQAMVLSSLVTGMIMMAVGSNFAVGFGIIGAVAVIRFRTVITDPRNIIFMFAAISIGIATGVKGYAIAVAGTVLFCLITILLYASAFGSVQNRYKLIIISEAGFDGNARLGSLTKKFSEKNRRLVADGRVRMEFLVELELGQKDQLFSSLSSEEGIKELRLEALPTSEDQL